MGRDIASVAEGGGAARFSAAGGRHGEFIRFPRLPEQSEILGLSDFNNYISLLSIRSNL